MRFSDIAGTVRSLFQVGLNGPNLRNNSGVLEARNAANTDYAVIRVSAIEVDNLATTQSNLGIGGGGGSNPRYSLPFYHLADTQASNRDLFFGISGNEFTTDLRHRSIGSNGITDGNCGGALCPVTGTIVAIALRCRSVGVQASSPSGPYDFRLDVFNNRASNALLSTEQIEIPNTITVGTFTSFVTLTGANFDTVSPAVSHSCNIAVTFGDVLGLRFVTQTGADKIGLAQGIFAALIIEES